jgi:hypothetical protein
MTKNVQLKVVQFKILHNAYPTMSHLHKWKIKNTPNCHHCNEVETTEHALWTCPIAQSTIHNLKRLLQVPNTNLTNISKEDFIFGKKSSHAINCIFAIVKRKLILQREEKLVLSLDALKRLIVDEIKIELAIHKKQKKLETFKKRWNVVLESLNVNIT